jgi:8-oxo-dGTP pyrophosphatase MutT (NUDIX family)
MPMLSIKNTGGFFNLRVAAVIRRERNLLLLNEPLAGPYWLLPGGRAEMHESTDLALAREVEEELGAIPKIGRLLWVIEDFFPGNGIRCHTIGFYYSVDLPPDHSLYSQEAYHTRRVEDGQDKRFYFRWCSPEEVLAMDVHPSVVKNLFPTIDNVPHVHHCVVGERPIPHSANLGSGLVSLES